MPKMKGRLTEEEREVADEVRSVLREKLNSCLEECESFYNLEVFIEAVSPNDNSVIVRSPSEVHIGDPTDYAFDLDAAIETMKGTKYELFFSKTHPAFWSYIADVMDLPMTLRVFIYPAPKKTKWYERQKPNPKRYVLIDSQDIPHFADFEGIAYTPGADEEP